MANLLDNKAPGCPFFRWEIGGRINCEGIVEGTTITQDLGEYQKDHLRIFCCENWENCEIYNAVAQKYPGMVFDKATLAKVIDGMQDQTKAMTLMLHRQRKLLELLTNENIWEEE